MKFDVTCNSSYTGSFSGVSTRLPARFPCRERQRQPVLHLQQLLARWDRVPLLPGSSTIADPLTVTGTVIQSSGTGKGAIQTCAGCSGDWSAGK